MNLIYDVRVDRWDIDQIISTFYNEITDVLETHPDSPRIRAILLLSKLEHTLMEYIADFAQDCAQEW